MFSVYAHNAAGSGPGASAVGRPFVSYVADHIASTDATSAAGRVIRGGSFSDLANSYSFPPYRFHYPPSGNYGIVGFRCARTP